MHTLILRYGSLLVYLSIIGTASANDQTPLVTMPTVTVADVLLTDQHQSLADFNKIQPVLIPRFSNNNQISSARTRNSKVMEGVQAMTSDKMSETIDVGGIDHMLSYLLERAGNYPPRFSDREERRNAIAEASALIKQIDQYAVHPNASPEILLRAVQVNQIGRNLDLGSGVAIKAGVYMRRAIALNPDDPATNYWYGTMLVEGGGMREGIPYLNRAITLGYKPAHLVLAQAYLHLERTEFALKALQNYYDAEPSKQEWTSAIVEKIKSGKTLVWSD